MTYPCSIPSIFYNIVSNIIHNSQYIFELHAFIFNYDNLYLIFPRISCNLFVFEVFNITY